MLARNVAMLVVLIMVPLAPPIHAVQLDAVIPRYSEEFMPTFQFTRIVTIQYAEDSKLAELVGDSQQHVTFGMDSENAKTLHQMISAELQKKSLVKVTDIKGAYSAIITPQKDSVTIEYKIAIIPTIKDHFLVESILDSQWRGFSITGAIPVETIHGTYDINSPRSVLVVIPEVAEYLESTPVKILDMPIIDTSGLSELVLSKWESMFDPTGKMSEPAAFGFSGEVVTNYSMGICTVYLGICQDREHTESFTVDSESYIIRSIESQDDGTIIIEGYVQESTLGGVEIFQVTDNVSNSGGEGQIPMVYLVAGIGVAATVGFFVWSDKKSKKTSTEQTGIDPRDLCAIPIGSSAGSYQTNRATAHLR